MQEHWEKLPKELKNQMFREPLSHKGEIMDIEPRFSPERQDTQLQDFLKNKYFKLDELILVSSPVECDFEPVVRDTTTDMTKEVKLEVVYDYVC